MAEFSSSGYFREIEHTGMVAISLSSCFLPLSWSNLKGRLGFCRDSEVSAGTHCSLAYSCLCSTLQPAPEVTPSQSRATLSQAGLTWRSSRHDSWANCSSQSTGSACCEASVECTGVHPPPVLTTTPPPTLMTTLLALSRPIPSKALVWGE